jgi:hypothetical protein
MGCWYSTCNLTNLPIVDGDRIVLILLSSNKSDSYVETINSLAKQDLMRVFYLPIRGHYNDYGSIDKRIFKKEE